MKIRILIFLLLTIPLSFKVELFPGVKILLQEPFILFFTFVCSLNAKSVKNRALPFVFLSMGLVLILISSLVSLFVVFDIIGVVKTLKYLMYAWAGIAILNSNYEPRKDLLNFMLKIGLWVVVISLCQYFYWFLMLEKTWQQFVSYSTWNANYMPTGLSNTVFDFGDFSFKRSGGNHGIYGSYLVLIFILNIGRLKETRFQKGKVLAALILLNISFITSRETLLLIFLTFFFLGIHYYIIQSKKFKQNVLIILGMGIIAILMVFLVWSPDVVILNKISHMIESFETGGGFDNNVNYRFNTWYLYFTYAFAHPWILLFGIGNNGTLFQQILQDQENFLPGSFPHAMVPESFYVTNLAYGGILALVFALLFFIVLFYILYRIGSNRARILSFFILGLMVTNGTGASILAELLISQLGLAYYATDVTKT